MRYYLPSLLILFALLASGCGKHCKATRNEVIEPTVRVIEYLQGNPDAAALAEGGCVSILSELERIPDGAESVRKLAEGRFHAGESRCLETREAYRYECYPDGRAGRIPRCYRERYTYCDRWEANEAAEPRYARALQLSRDLDLVYFKAHHMCGAAFAGEYPESYSESRELLHFLTTRVRPEGELVYSQACGSI